MHQHGCEIFNKTWSFEFSTGLLGSFQLSHQKKACYRSFMKICQHEAGIFIQNVQF